MSHKRLEISEGELDDIEKQSGASPSLVLTAEELDKVGRPTPQRNGRYPKVELAGARTSTKELSWSKLDQIAPTQVWQMILAGVLGAIAFWAPYELFIGERDVTGSALIDTGIFGTMLAFFLSFSFGATHGWLNQKPDRAWRDGLIQGGIGAIGGLSSSIAGQVLYSVLGGGVSSGLSMQIVARTIAWTVVGSGIGLANGIVSRNTRRTVNGLVGGLIGGAMGGLLFDFIGALFQTGAVSRLIAFLALGGMTGLMIGLVEHLRKEAWFSVQDGPLKGKQFIIFNKATTFGASGKADIVLFGDPSLPAFVFRLDQTPDGRFMATALEPHYPVFQNGEMKRSFYLRNRDLVQVGEHILRFQERATARSS